MPTSTYNGAMTERIVTCGACGETGTIAAMHWNEVQRRHLESWLTDHANRYHDGEEHPYEISPDPMLDRGEPQ